MSIDTQSSKPRESLWNELNWQPSPKQLQKLIQLQTLLEYWNTQTNLTRLISGDDFWIGQVFDSLWPLKHELNKPNEKLLCVDVGSGCGFPGLAVAIALTGSKVLLIDSVRKKTDILKQITHELDLSTQITISTKRIEAIGQDSNFRGKFDLAMARAVSTAPVVSEYLIPLLHAKGEALIYKGKWNKINQEELNKALIILNAKVSLIETKLLPGERGERNSIRLVPKGKCPAKYPRAIGLPKKYPLGH
tara:strand:+ start:13002 stop:13745 length:744 start_codon:yes stop_codon:yes gene_type:complete